VSMVCHYCNPGACRPMFFHAAPNVSNVSVSFLSKVGSNTDWSKEELELEINKILGAHLEVPRV
jgi:hypothetical protein